MVPEDSNLRCSTVNAYLGQVSRVPSSCQNFKCAHFFDVNLLLRWSTVVRSNDQHALRIKLRSKSTIPTESRLNTNLKIGESVFDQRSAIVTDQSNSTAYSFDIQKTILCREKLRLEFQNNQNG